MDLLREQVKMLAGEVALCTSSEKRLTEQAAKNPDDLEIQVYLSATAIISLGQLYFPVKV